MRSEKPIQLRPWLFTIARNRCLSVLRARREQPSRGVERAGRPRGWRRSSSAARTCATSSATCAICPTTSARRSCWPRSTPSATPRSPTVLGVPRAEGEGARVPGPRVAAGQPRGAGDRLRRDPPAARHRAWRRRCAAATSAATCASARAAATTGSQVQRQRRQLGVLLPALRPLTLPGSPTDASRARRAAVPSRFHVRPDVQTRRKLYGESPTFARRPGGGHHRRRPRHRPRHRVGADRPGRPSGDRRHRLGARRAHGRRSSAPARSACRSTSPAASSFEAFLREVESRLGPLDVLINNAGIMPIGPFAEESDATAKRMIDINLHGVIYGSKLALERFVPRRPRPHRPDRLDGRQGRDRPRRDLLRHQARGRRPERVAARRAARHRHRTSAWSCPRWSTPSSGPACRTPAGSSRPEPEDVAAAIVEALQTGRFEVWVPKSGAVVNRV